MITDDLFRSRPASSQTVFTPGRTVAVVISLCLASLRLPLAAQSLPPVRSFDAAELGGELQFWDIAQAPDGTMAFATQAGLALFDGVRWRTLAVPRGHTLRTVIYRPADSSWLAGGYDGWWRWRWGGRVKDRHLVQPQRITPPGDLKEEWWHAFTVPGDEEAIWWQTFSRVMRQSPGNVVQSVALPGNVLFARAVRDTLYLPVLGAGLYRREKADWIKVPGGEAFAGEEVVGIAAAPQSGLLVATKSGTLTRLHGGGAESWLPPKDRPWRANLTQFVRLRDGRFAVATAGDGLYLLSADGREWSQLRAGRGLVDDAVLSVFEDREGGLWVGQENGLNYLPALPGVNVLGAELGPVYDYSPDQLGRGAFVATSRGLFRIDDSGEATAVPGFFEQVWHVNATPGGLVVGTNAATYSLDAASFERRQISTLTGGWSWLTLDSARALSGTYVGLERYVRGPNGWESRGRVGGWDRPCRQVVQRPGFSDRFLLVDPQEGLWGFALDADGRQITTLEQIDTVPGWLIEAGGGLHYRCPEHTVYFASDGSVAASAKPACYLPQPVGPHRRATDLEVCLSAESLALRRGSDAVQSLPLRANLRYPLVQRLSDGAVIIGLESGFARLEPEAVPVLAASASATAALRQIGDAVEIELAQRRFGDGPRFRARLVGVDTAFSPWSATGDFAYAALRPGDYSLEWESDDGQTGRVEWTIPPPWYQTRWAYILYGVAVAAGFWLLRIYYRRRLSAQQRRADLERERQVNAERLRARTARLEDEVRVTQLQVELSQRELALRQNEVEQRNLELALRQNEVEQRNRELADATLTQARHNEALLQLREGLAELPKSGEVGKTRRHLSNILETSLDATEDWARFAEHFDAVHVGFLHRLNEAYTDLTPGDLRLAALLRMNLASKEIAPLLHLSLRGVENKRYRLRKKLGLEADDNLAAFILGY